MTGYGGIGSSLKVLKISRQRYKAPKHRVKSADDFSLGPTHTKASIWVSVVRVGRKEIIVSFEK